MEFDFKMKIKDCWSWFGLGDERVLNIQIRGRLSDADKKIMRLKEFLNSSEFWDGGE